MSVKLNYLVGKINETLQLAAKGCNVSSNQNSVSLAFANNASGFTATLPIASTAKAGVMSTTHVTTLANLANRMTKAESDIRKLGASIDAAVSAATATEIEVTFYSEGQQRFAFEIPTATEETAGVLTPADYRKLQRASVQYYADELTTAVQVQTTGWQPTTGLEQRHIVFDTLNNRLLLAVGMTATKKYYYAWVDDENGNSQLDYTQEGTSVITSSATYTWSGEKWQRAGAAAAAGLFIAPRATWLTHEKDFKIEDTQIRATDKAVLYRYISTTLGKQRSQRLGKQRAHRHGWISAEKQLELEIVNDGEGQWIIKPKDFDSFGAYEQYRNRQITPSTLKNKRPFTLRKRCGIIIMRDGQPISAPIEFTIDPANYVLSRVGSLQSYAQKKGA